MSPASGPVLNPKFHPAATLDDQEGVMDGTLGEATVMGTPPFSSPDPVTDARRMLPLEDGTSAHQSALEAEQAREGGESSEITDYDSMKSPELKALVEERGLETEGNKKADYVSALKADDAADMKAGDFIAAIKAATTQEELDAVAELYDAQDRELTTVERAFDTRQDELNAENDDSTEDDSDEDSDGNA